MARCGASSNMTQASRPGSSTTGSSPRLEVDNPSGAVLRRYVRGDGPDELLVWYEGSGTADRRFLSTDERGSVIAATGSSGALIGVNSYDEYGKPGAANIGRFQYTGQMWLPEVAGLSLPVPRPDRPPRHLRAERSDRAGGWAQRV